MSKYSHIPTDELLAELKLRRKAKYKKAKLKRLENNVHVAALTFAAQFGRFLSPDKVIECVYVDALDEWKVRSKEIIMIHGVPSSTKLPYVLPRSNRYK